MPKRGADRMNVNRNRQRGKECEKAIAKMFNGKRVGILGNEDVQHPKYSIEVKSRVKFVGKKWMEQCERNNIDNKIPLVVVHEMNKKHDNDFVIMKISDFLKEVADEQA